MRALSGIVARAKPVHVVGALVVVQWAALGAFVLTVRHNGWLFYQGGDQTFYYSTSWAFTQLHLPATSIGYGWSYLMAPIAAVAGQSVLGALPAIVLIQAIVLLPLAVVCIYAIGTRLGGRPLGYLAAAAWVAAPWVAIPFFDPRYHPRYVEQFLPQALGLTNLGDFPSMVCLLVAAVFCLRALEGDSWRDLAAGGLAAGFAIAIKPANALFLVAPVLAFLVARRPRPLLVLGAALVPAVLTLVLWKWKGLGYFPLIQKGRANALAAGTVVAASPSHYLHVDWHGIGDNLLAFREFFFSARMLEYVPIAGAIAAWRRSFPVAVFLASWFGAYLLVKGGSGAARVESGSFFRLMMPAWPAYLLLGVSLPLLVPTVGGRIAALRGGPPRPWGRRQWRGFAVAAVVFAGIPLVLIAAFPALRDKRIVDYFPQGVLLPVDRSFAPKVTHTAAGEVITWPRRAPHGIRTFYRVFRSAPTRPGPAAGYPPGEEGIRCEPHFEFPRGALRCSVEMDVLAATPATRWVDHAPPGRWTYRVGLASNWLADPSLGDVLQLSAPTTVTVPDTQS